MIIDVNMVMGGFVSKVINDCGDILKSKIKKADENRKSFERNIETKIYQVIIDAINAFTHDTYKGQEKLYDAAESILKGFKVRKENIEAVKAGLKVLEPQITDGRCQGFLRTLYDEICKDENNILYKEIVLIYQRQTQECFRESAERQNDALQILDDVREDTRYLRERCDNKDFQAAEHNKIQVQNKASEYDKKWNENVFLNNFKKRDGNAGVNIKLRDLYRDEQLPHYTWKMKDEKSYDLKELLKEYVVDDNGKNMLLILGQPGIGKSTLITWIIANFPKKGNDFLVYQFASDLKDVNWQDSNILIRILETLNLKYDELENKVLILDGFDEIYANSDREKILNKLNQELAKMSVWKNFSLIITCRENYVHELKKIECEFITLQIWDEGQVERFCEIYGNKSGSNIPKTKINKILESKEVFGIPLILYMVLALDIAIEESGSLVQVYDQIFSLDRSSIYDRCIDNARYGEDHRISNFKIKQQIHRVSQRIAFWIFENNPEKAFIPQKEYKDICDAIVEEASDGSESIKRDFLIGNYFKLINHCDGVGTQELHFIHRSIYEYFVVVYFFESLCDLTTKEEIAGKLGELFKIGHLSEQILQFIKYKFNGIKTFASSDIVWEVFQVMLQDDMTYHMKRKCKNIISLEMNIFSNMLKVVHMWKPMLEKFDNKMVYYLQYNRLNDLDLRFTDLSGADLNGTCLFQANLLVANLRGVKLSGANLSGADLRRADLSGAKLSGAKLSGADLIRANLRSADLSGAKLSGAKLSGAKLSGADLRSADLSGADLRRADLSGTKLSGAKLSGADLSGADLRRANLRGADLSRTIFDKNQIYTLKEEYDLSNSRVFIFRTGEILDYKEYYKRQKE